MVREKKAKKVGLVIAMFVMGLAVLPFDAAQVGICRGCSLPARCLYPFFHANLLHAICNAWCLLSLAFIYHFSLGKLATAFIIAATVPACLLSDVPTVGLSGICFALMGMVAFSVRRKLYYQCWVVAFILVGFLFPNANAMLHLYCYVAGLMVGFLNSPAPWKRK